jgi:hypothetical protein
MAGRLAPWLAAACVGLTGACARQSLPPGGPEDRRPPVVVRTSPEALGTLSRLDAAIVFEFDERISEQVSGGLQNVVTISPRSGELRVDHGRRTLTVNVAGGFRPGLVYRVTLNPVVSDLFGNRMSDPFELVFSTGGEPEATTVAGEVWNRISGQPVPNATVYAIGPDSLVHQATTDADGIFAFRYLPAGPYEITAFEDLNRDTEVDSTEVQGTGPIEIARGDTLIFDLPILSPDTAPATVQAATALDSVTVAVRFDDFLDPALSASSIQVSLGREDGAAPDVARILHEVAYQEYVDEVMDSLARLDSIAAAEAAAAGDTAVADTLVPPDSVLPVDTLAPPDSARVGAARPARPRGPPRLPPLQGSRAGTTADGRRVLPGRRIVLLLSPPLEPGVEYELRLAEVTNIAGLPGGGGTAPLVWEPEPDGAAADTLPRDTLR